MRRLGWFGHVERMEDGLMTKKFMQGNGVRKRCIHNVKKNLRGKSVRKHRDSWRLILMVDKAHPSHWNFVSKLA